MWSALAILWLQNVVTGFAYIADHFVYSVWILSALSWMMWSKLAPAIKGTRIAKVAFGIGVVAAAYAAAIVWQIAFKYTLISMGGELIHLAAWTFIALALLGTPLGTHGQKMLMRTAFVIAACFTIAGFMGAYRFAGQETSALREYRGFIQWTSASRSSNQDITWCSDWNAEQILAPNTGLKIFPNTVALLDNVTTSDLQRRQIESAAFFNAIGSDQGWRYERQILYSEDLLCDLNARMRGLVGRVVTNGSTRAFIIGCDPAVMDVRRAVVIEQMKARWAAPLPETSSVCDRFIVRKSMEASFRIPASYGQMYADDALTVYGRR